LSQPLVEASDIVRRHPGQPPVESLSGVSLTVEAGELVAVVGPSGSGKTTLLHIVGTLDHPTSGRLRIAGVDVMRMSDSKLSGFRSHHLGFVFQQFFLLEGMSILDNVANGLLYRGLAARGRQRLAERALQRVGLEHRTLHRPAQLSGGERQRAAIARAVVGEPDLILADEPTGNLDSASGNAVVTLLKDLNREGTTVVVVTHNPGVARAMHRIVELQDGRIQRDVRLG